jgi:hypothetical protein
MLNDLKWITAFSVMKVRQQKKSTSFEMLYFTGF